MANYFLTNGVKTVPFEGGTWDFAEMVASGNVKQNALYARVAAVFAMINKTSKAVANVPFALVDVKTGEDYDVSWAWENKVGFMPRPKDLIRRVQQSIIMTNKGYLRMGKNMLGQPKKLNFVIPDTIEINTDTRGDLLNLRRIINGMTAQTYAPDDYDLMRFWWLDEKTELIPTDDTEFKAAMNAAEILFYADFFTANFYKRGGIKPTLIAMKGMVSKDKAEAEEGAWSKFLRGIGRSAVANVTRIFNADTMSVQAFGDGLGDLKETPVYEQALKNVCMAGNMPFSILISNSANRATAQVENDQWHEDSIFPRVEFMHNVFNEQLFADMGLRMEPRPENEEDPADEETRARAFAGFGAAFAAYPDAETYLGAADMFGFEMDDKYIASVEKYYASKAPAAPTVAEMPAEPVEDDAEEIPMEDDTEEMEDDAPAPKSWQPNIDQLNELRVWRDVALRRHRKGESMNFDYQVHYGGLPGDVMQTIKNTLTTCTDVDSIKAAFVLGGSAAPVTVSTGSDEAIKALADAINRLAMPAPVVTSQQQPISVTVHNHPAEAPIVNMPEGKAAQVIVNVEPAPVNNVVNVPAPVVNVTNEVAPPKVVLNQGATSATVTRDANGSITGMVAK